MFNDDFKTRYTTLPFAIYKACFKNREKDVIMHQHQETELISMTEGSAVLYVDSKQYHMRAGDVLVIPPYALHKVHVSKNETAVYYCICFSSELLCDEEIREKLEANEKHLVGREEDCAPRIQSFIENAFIACEKNETGWELNAMGNIFLMFGLLKQRNFFSQSVKSASTTNFGKRVMDYIIENYSAELSSRDAAGALYMNYSYFCRLFKKTFGCSFSNYILAYRLERSKPYLSDSELSVTEVALKTGIGNCSYYCKAFKERFFMTPLAYRKKALSNKEKT